MAVSQSIEDILEKQCNKLQQLEIATEFLKCRNNVKHELQDMCAELRRLSNDVESTKQCLNRMKEQNVQCRKLISLIEELDKKIVHMEQNVPPDLIRDYMNTDKHNKMSAPVSSNSDLYSNLSCENIPSVNNKTTSKSRNIKDCKKVLFNELEVFPTVSFITKEEFDKIPKYIIQRQSLETLNKLVSTINQVLKAKYSILSLGKATAQKRGEINLYLHYKKQEISTTDEEKHMYFFTGEDYYRQTKMKLDKTKLNLITALRHCKRLREYRTKEDLRYVVID